MKSLGLLAYGSITGTPGTEIEAATESKLENQQTPFKVEFAHASKYRNGAPALVPVDTGGSNVSCTIFIMKEGTTEKDATDMLYRREIGQPGSKKQYTNPEKGMQNTVYIEKIDNYNDVQTILYTKILPDITPLTAEELAKRAIESALADAGEQGIDGITYLKNAIAVGIKTPLTPEYEKAILKTTQTTDLNQALYVLTIERLKKKGEVPQDCETIFKMPTIDDVGKTVAFRATIGETYVKLSPPLEIVTYDNSVKYIRNYEANFFGMEAKISRSYLYVGFPEKTTIENVLDYFNNLIAVWNILGLPFDFVTRSDVLVRAKCLGGYMELISSSKAHYRGYGLAPVEVSFDEIMQIETATRYLSKIIGSSPYFKDDNFFQLLGYAKYYEFHGIHLLSFVHAWMFIESCINLLWSKLIDVAFQEISAKRTSPASNERNWTSQIKVDELFLRGVIDVRLRDDIQLLRNKRNHVFHQDKKIEKRIVSEEDANKAVETGLTLFLKMTNIQLHDETFNFKGIIRRMWESINRTPYVRPDKKEKS